MFDKVYHLVVFPPFTGGHHLAQMMSTEFTDYTQEQLDTIYNDQRIEVDGYSYLYADKYLSCFHLEGAISFIKYQRSRKLQHNYQVTVLQLPRDWDSLIGQRILRRAEWMRPTNIRDLHDLVYSAESVAKLLELPVHRVYEIDSNDMVTLSATDLLAKIPNLAPNLSVCNLVHNRWQAMITR